MTDAALGAIPIASDELESPGRRALRRLFQRKGAVAGLVVIAAFIVLALFPGLFARDSPSAEDYARNLAYGQQRRLEIARALATRPHLLLLDEPAAGFTPQEKVELMRLVDKILGEGITVFLIEHDMKVVMGISRNIAVLDHGELIALGPPEVIRRDQRVIEAYLGKGA